MNYGIHTSLCTIVSKFKGVGAILTKYVYRDSPWTDCVVLAPICDFLWDFLGEVERRMDETGEVLHNLENLRDSLFCFYLRVQVLAYKYEYLQVRVLN